MKEKILELINGNDGIVSLIGDNRRGENIDEGRIPQSNIPQEVHLSNILSKIFFRAKDPTVVDKINKATGGAVYTSVVSILNKLYYSFQTEKGDNRETTDSERINPGFLNKEQIDSTITILNQIALNSNNLLDLFIEMHKNRNNIVKVILIKYNDILQLVITKERNVRKKSKESDNFNRAFKSLKDFHDLTEEKKKLFNEEEKKFLYGNEVFKNNISSILMTLLELNSSSLELNNQDPRRIDDIIRNYKCNNDTKIDIKNIKDFIEDKENIILKYDQVNNGVHVEVKAVYQAIIDHSKNNLIKIYIGLGKCEPCHYICCCVGCSTELEVLSNSDKLIIYRTADSNNNFPPTNYQVSCNIKNNEENVIKFAKLLLDKSKKVYPELTLLSTLEQNLEIINAEQEKIKIVVCIAKSIKNKQSKKGKKEVKKEISKFFNVLQKPWSEKMKDYYLKFNNKDKVEDKIGEFFDISFEYPWPSEITECLGELCPQ